MRVAILIFLAVLAGCRKTVTSPNNFPINLPLQGVESPTSDFKAVDVKAGGIRITRCPKDWNLRKDDSSPYRLYLEPGMGKETIRVMIEPPRTHISDVEIRSDARIILNGQEFDQEGLKRFRARYPGDKSIALAASKLQPGLLWKEGPTPKADELDRALIGMLVQEVLGDRVPSCVEKQGLQMFYSTRNPNKVQPYGRIWLFRGDSQEGSRIRLPMLTGPDDKHSYTEAEIATILRVLCECVKVE